MSFHLAWRVSLHLLPSCLLFGEQVVQPAATFDIDASMASTASPLGRLSDRIQLTDSDIYLSYLTPGRDSQRYNLLRVSRVGAIISAKSIGGPPLPVNLTFDEVGDAFVTRLLGDRTLLLEKHASGGVTQTIPLLSTVTSVTIVGSAPVLLGADGSLTPVGSFPPQWQRHRLDASAESSLFRTIDSHTVAIVDRFSGIIRIIDLNDGALIVPTVLDVPEVREAKQKLDLIMSKAPAKAARPMLFFDAAADGKGNLFVAVAPGHLARGMLIVQIGRDGRHARTLRLQPAMLARLKSEANPNGWVLQRNFSVRGSTIATAAATGVISLYSLP